MYGLILLKYWSEIVLLFVAVALAGIRIAGHTSESFQAAAHLFVGGLFASAYTEYWTERKCTNIGLEGSVKFKIVLGLILSLIELSMAIWSRL